MVLEQLLMLTVCLNFLHRNERWDEMRLLSHQIHTAAKKKGASEAATTKQGGGRLYQVVRIMGLSLYDVLYLFYHTD